VIEIHRSIFLEKKKDFIAVGTAFYAVRASVRASVFSRHDFLCDGSIEWYCPPVKKHVAPKQVNQIHWISDGSGAAGSHASALPTPHWND
jgi:hypothetical protein